MAANTAVTARLRTARAGTRIVACVLVALVITAGAAVGLSHDVFSGVQDSVADRYVFPRGHVDDSIIVVGIDARSLAETGESWPWPRATQAELVSKLHDGGARVIALDMLHASEEAGDEQFSQVIAEAGNVVVTEAAEVAVSTNSSRSDAGYAADGALEATSITPPVESIADAATGVGHSSITPDANDGVARRVPLVVEDGLRVVPALSLAVLAADTNTTNSPILQPHGGLQVGSVAIPTDDHYGLRLSYAKGLLGAASTDDQTSRVVSAVDVLQGRVTDFHDKVVFVGATDQTLGDNHAIPMGRRGGVPGVFVHANAYNTMVTQAYLQRASTTTTLITIFLLTVIVGLAVQFLPIWAAALVSVSCLAGYVLVCATRAQAGTISNLVYPVLAIILVVPLSGGIRYTFIERRRRLVASLFSQYVPDAVAADLVHRGLVESAIAGNRMDVTVLFCDIRGFTALTARVGAGQIRSMLDRYYEHVSSIVLAHGGTVVQFVGDEVFAVFGAPVADPDHATSAMASALAVQERSAELDEQLLAVGDPTVEFGIGVHTGEVVAAHVGSSHRRQYTVVGDAVNVGARLCAQAGAGQVVLSAATYRECEPQPDVKPMGALTMKGVPDDFVAWKIDS